MRNPLEDREIRHRRQRKARHHDLLTADLVRQPAEQDEARCGEQERDGDHDLRRHRVDLDRLSQEEQRIELSAVPHDRFARRRTEECQDRDLAVFPVAEGFRERRFGLRALFLHLLEHRRFRQLQADPDGHAEQDHRQQERQTPAPIEERFFTHIGADAEDDQQRHEQAKRCRRLDPRGVEAAFAARRMFGNIGRRTAIFAAESQALHEAQQDQHDRRRNAP